jgi:hypothetical protein
VLGASGGANAFAEPGVPLIENATAITSPIANIDMADMYLARFACSFDFFMSAAKPKIPVSQVTKLAAMGAAARMQGYVALLGFGITRTKNHISDARPKNGSSTFFHHFCFLGTCGSGGPPLIILPVLGHLLISQDVLFVSI